MKRDQSVCGRGIIVASKSFVPILIVVFIAFPHCMYGQVRSSATDSLAPFIWEALPKEWPTEADSLALVLLDSMQVCRIDLKLSSDPDEARRRLWATFANRDLAKRYGQLQIPPGERAWSIFRDRLLEVAREKGMKYQSLEKSLDQIYDESGYLAQKCLLFPFGAFLARQGQDDAWIIPCLWESGASSKSEGVPYPVRAHHIRIWAFMTTSGEKVGYVTCK